MTRRSRNMSAADDPKYDPKMTRKKGTDAPAISVQDFSTDTRLMLLRSYQGGGFQVNDDRLEGPIFLFPRAVQLWQAPPLDRLTASAIISQLPELGPKQFLPELFLLGTGGQPDNPFYSLRDGLAEAGCKLEVMATPAACRTWNVLMSEGRSVAAGLLVAPPDAR